MNRLRTYVELAGRTVALGDAHFIAEVLPENSSAAVDDLRQLWRRIAFSIAIHNTDDHLRLTDHQARVVLREVVEAAENWGPTARRNGIGQSEVARFEPTLTHTIDAVRVS